MIRDTSVRTYRLSSRLCQESRRAQKKTERLDGSAGGVYGLVHDVMLMVPLTGLGGAIFSPESVAPGATQKKMVGSVMFFQADTLEEVKKTVENDIYYTSGVVRSQVFLISMRDA